MFKVKSKDTRPIKLWFCRNASQKRFEQPDYQIYLILENVAAIKEANNKDYWKDQKLATQFYLSNFPKKDLQFILTYLQNFTKIQYKLIIEVIT